jgi:hypothetical protein
MAHNLVETATWATSVDVIDVAEEHTAAKIEAPHQVHADRTQFLKVYHDDLRNYQVALSGVPWAGGTIVPVETVAAGANSATVLLTIASGDLTTGNRLFVDWHVTCRTIPDTPVNQCYIMLYDTANAVYIGNGGCTVHNDAGVPTSPEMTAHGFSSHTVTAGEATAGYSIRIRNGTGSGASIYLAEPWKISAWIL